MALIETIAVLRQHLPEVEKSTNPSMFIPTCVKVENEKIRKIIGQNLLDQLRLGSLDSDYTELLTKCRDVLAPLIYYKAIPKLAVRFGDTGINTADSTDFTAAQKWRVDALRTSLLQDGYTAIQELYLYLESGTSKTWYEAWFYSDAYATYKGIILNRAEQMQLTVNINDSYWLFACMLPEIRMIQDRYIQGAIGSEFLENLLSKYKNDELTTDEKTAFEKLQKAISYLTYGHALRNHSFLQEYVIETSTRTESITAMQNIDSLAKVYESQSSDYLNKGQAALADAKEWINSKAAIDVFIPFFESSLYVAESIPESLSSRTINDEANGTFFLM